MLTDYDTRESRRSTSRASSGVDIHHQPREPRLNPSEIRSSCCVTKKLATVAVSAPVSGVVEKQQNRCDDTALVVVATVLA
jgi:hypothetical protein